MRKVSPATAEAVVTAADTARADYIRRYFGRRWDDPAPYDIIINMAWLSVEAASQMLCAAVSPISTHS
jgi:hypothetical protein